MLILLPPLLAMNLIKNLKWLAPFSMVANLLIATGMVITLYYIFSSLGEAAEVPSFASVQTLPIFFGTAIFALEGIGVVSVTTTGDSSRKNFKNQEKPGLEQLKLAKLAIYNV